MTEAVSFAERIRQHFPEGLTGIFAVGGTRTTFILEDNQKKSVPGEISDFSTYVSSAHDRYFNLIKDFLDLGGQNMVIPLLAYQRFFDKGEEYARAVSQFCLWLTNQKSIDFYEQNQIDPYFVGIDTLLQLPEDHFGYQLASGLAAFQQHWVYKEGRHKLIWEIAPIPLFSFWRAHKIMGGQAQVELETQIDQAGDLKIIHDLLYKYYARAVYGTDLPIPHFYLGTNRNGDLKLRAMLPIALLCGGPFRMYYTPYPSLSLTRETMQAILEDLAFGKPLRSTKFDYSGQVTSELLDAEYERVLELSSDPSSTVGMVRVVSSGDSD